MKYISNNTKIILFINGKSISIEKTDKRYPKIVKVFELPVSEQEDAVLKVLEPTEVSVKSIHGQNGFEVVGDDIFYKGEKLPNAFATKIKSIIRDGLPLEHFEKFWENLEQNPSYSVLHETGFIDFLEYAELPITEDGYFLAYRGVQDDYYSKSGNPATKVLQGTVNERGQIYNGIGEVIEVKRNGVIEDRSIACAHIGSLHIGSKDYATSWASKVIVVKVNPKDVVSVPYDCNAQKCRVSKFEVLYDYEGEIESSVVDSKGGETIVTNDSKERNDFIDKISNYLNRKADTCNEVTVRQIQNSFSPIWPSKESILDALQQLGYFWTDQDGVLVVEL